MPIPELELDDRWFEVLARNETAVLTKHRNSNALDIWRLEWRHKAAYPPSAAADAWEAFLKTST